MQYEMDGSQKTWIGTIAIAGASTFLSLVCVISVTGVVNNDRAKIERDRMIKIECIKAGKQVISGNCVTAQPK